MQAYFASRCVVLTAVVWHNGHVLLLTKKTSYYSRMLLRCSEPACPPYLFLSEHVPLPFTGAFRRAVEGMSNKEGRAIFFEISTFFL